MNDLAPPVSEQGWECVAYGDTQPGCFFAAAGTCTTLDQCETRMVAERRRVFRRLQELAAHGDPVAKFLDGEFTHPEQLLNATEDDTPQ